MNRPRDTGRSKVYSAEKVSTWPDPANTRFASQQEAQAYVNEVLASAWVQSRWGQHRVRLTRGRGDAATSWGGRVSVGVAGRHKALLLHELAHELLGVARSTPYASHGPEFRATLLVLIERFMGQESAAALRSEFLRRNLRHREGVSAVPPARTHRVLSPAAGLAEATVRIRGGKSA